MGIVFILGIAGVVFYLWMKNAKVGQEHWAKAAERLGLGYYPGGLGMLGKIHGRKGGHRVEISTYTKGSGNSSSTYTKYHVRYHEPIQTDFTITREKGFHKLGQVFGMQDIEVGDPSFDDRALIRGMNPQNVREFLTPERRRAIQHLLVTASNVEITNEYIEVNKSNKDMDVAVLFSTTRRMLSVCNELTDTSHSIAEEEHILEIDEMPSAAPILNIETPVEERPDPDFPADPFVKEANDADFIEEWPSDAPEPVQDVEPIEPAFDPFSSATPIVPDPPMVEVNADESGDEEEPIAENEVPEPEAAEEGDEPAVPEPLSGEAVDLMSVAEGLYGADSGGALKVASAFSEAYENARVTGAGLLKRVSRFNYDPVFKGEAGVKATVEICEIAGAYSKIKVKADVAFPAERHAELKIKVGSTLPITGKLIAQDAMLHQLYVVHE